MAENHAVPAVLLFQVVRSVYVATMAGKSLTILHFNDVYNIEPQEAQEPQGGAARMAQYVKSVKDLTPLVLFSGDALNPSLSKKLFKSILEARQMT